MNLEKLKAQNAQRWNHAKLTRHDFYQVAERLLQGKERYRAVSQRTGVPWFVIAVIHEREASGRWDAQLAQGDPLHQISRHVPYGRGPFEKWEDGAYDALALCPPYAARNRDWSVGGTLTLLEQYNGLGYANKGIPSPYIWAGTDQYTTGKYVADGRFEWGTVDHQLGCAGLLVALREIDPSVRFDNEAMPPPDVHPQEPKPVPTPVPRPIPKHAAPPAAGTLAGTIAHLLGLPIWGVLAVALAIAVAVYFITRRK